MLRARGTDFDPRSGIAASDTQSAIETVNAAAIASAAAVADDVAHLVTLSGVATDAVNLGTFSGSTIPDDQTNKQALQALETAVEGKQPADADLTAIAALTTATYGRSMLETVSAAAARALLSVREMLTATRTYYVRTDGSDSNTGLVNNSDGAFLTVQKAVDVVCGIDVGGYAVTIQIADGTYAENILLKNYSGRVGRSSFVPKIVGNTGNVSGVKIAPASGDAFFALETSGSEWFLDYMEINGVDHNIVADAGSWVTVGHVKYMAATIHLFAQNGGFIEQINDFEVAGAGTGFAYASTRGQITFFSCVGTVTGSPTFTAFGFCDKNALITGSASTFTGACTAFRYSVSQGGGIYSGGVGASWLPGSGPGLIAGTGWYDLLDASMTTYQPLDSDLTAIAALTTTSYGRAFLALADAAAARAALALGTIATQNANNVTITGGSVTGITDIAIVDGGTGASTATAGFDALAPTTTRGDIIFRNATVNARLAAGTSGYALQTNGASADPTWVFKQETLTAARTYYVRTDGNDANDGLANTSGGAKLTIQGAVDAVSLINLAGQTVTIQVADGTYTASVSLKNAVGFASPGSLILTGNSGTPTNVVAAGTITADSLSVAWRVTNMRVGVAGAAADLLIKNSHVQFSGIDFAVCTVAQIWVNGGGKAEAVGNYTISAGSASHARIDNAGQIIIGGRTCTISNTPAFSAAFAYANVGPGVIVAHVMTFAGTGATGSRYYVDSNSVIYTGVGGATYLPGNAAGSTATGGQYV